MSNARFIPVNDFDDATLVATPAMEATMPETNAQLEARDRISRSTSIASQTYQGHWSGNERKPNGLIIKSNGWGGKVRFRIHGNVNYTDDNYDSGTVDLGGPLPTLETFEWGVAPLGLTTSDLLAKESCYSLWWTGVTGASFTLTLSQCQDLYWEVNRVVLGTYVEAPYNPVYGMSFGPMRNSEHTRMRGASLRSLSGGRWNELSANMVYATEAQRAAWLDLVSRITNNTVGVSIFPGVGGRQERDHVDVMALQDASPNAWSQPSFHESSIRMIGI